MIRRVAQVEQTLDWFSQALIQLMEKYPYQEITISQLSDKAGLSRRTFYRHFNNIDDVFQRLVQLKVDELFLFMKEHEPKTFDDVVFSYFKYWSLHKNFLTLLKKHQLMHWLLYDLAKNMDKSFLDNYFINNHDYIYSFASGGIWNLLVLWVEKGAIESPMEMKNVAKNISKHMKDIS